MSSDAPHGALDRPFALGDAPPILPLVSPAASDGIEEVVRALGAAGVAALEITLRHSAALEALRRAVIAAPAGLTVGVGTVRTVEDLERALDVGAAFVVSPGLDERLASRSADGGIPYVPGVATPTEVLAAVRLGLRLLKFFPAEAMGGTGTLRALGEPFPDVSFVPTGGVGEGNLAEYLALPNVWCCGGSWIIPTGELARGDASGIAARVSHARSIAASMRGRRDVETL